MRTKRWTLRIIAERELQKTHPRQAELLPQVLHWRSDYAQIFRHNRQSAKRVLHGRQKILSRPFDPAPVDGGRFAGGNLPVRFKAAEMIEPHHIEKRERGTEALDPPLVSAGGQQVPAINRVPPELSRGAEIIRRHTGDYGRAALIVEIEQIGMGPHIRAVVRNIDREVAHETDTALLAISLELFPLLEELVLPILVGLHLRR